MLLYLEKTGNSVKYSDICIRLYDGFTQEGKDYYESNDGIVLLLDVVGRAIYNHIDIKEQKNLINLLKKIIRNQDGSLISRFIEAMCEDASSMIANQRAIDEVLIEELKRLNNENSDSIYNISTSFSIAYKIGNTISNAETIVLNTSTSNKPYRLSKVETLGAYSNMEYSCWDYITNSDIKNVFSNKADCDTPQEKHAFAQIISLFTCETSRNPTTFLTAPMVLELVEYCLNNQNEYKQQYKKNFETEFGKLDKKYKKLTTELKNKKLTKEAFSKEEKELEKKYCNDIKSYISSVDQESIPLRILSNITDGEKVIQCLESKSVLTQQLFLIYFPMAIKDAVGASRKISDLINEATEKADLDGAESFNLYHMYDYGRSDINKAKELTQKTWELTELWLQIQKEKLNCADDMSLENIEQLLVGLTKEWYDVDLQS